jgi:hypothetical protein
MFASPDIHLQLRQAAASGNSHAVQQLLRHNGIDVNARGGKKSRGGTALHLAVTYWNDAIRRRDQAAQTRFSHVACLLIAHGASVTQTNDEGNSPLDLARHQSIRTYIQRIKFIHDAMQECKRIFHREQDDNYYESFANLKNRLDRISAQDKTKISQQIANLQFPPLIATYYRALLGFSNTLVAANEMNFRYKNCGAMSSFLVASFVNHPLFHNTNVYIMTLSKPSSPADAHQFIVIADSIIDIDMHPGLWGNDAVFCDPFTRDEQLYPVNLRPENSVLNKGFQLTPYPTKPHNIKTRQERSLAREMHQLIWPKAETAINLLRRKTEQAENENRAGPAFPPPER